MTEEVKIEVVKPPEPEKPVLVVATPKPKPKPVNTYEADYKALMITNLSGKTNLTDEQLSSKSVTELKLIRELIPNMSSAAKPAEGADKPIQVSNVPPKVIDPVVDALQARYKHFEEKFKMKIGSN